MALKAVKVTEDNRKMLEERYALEEDQCKEYLGFYLVVNFGEDARPEGFIGEPVFDDMYIRGGALKNNFFEVIKR